MEGAWAVVHDLFEIIGGLAAAVAVGFSVWIASREHTDRQQAERDRDEAREAQRRAESNEHRRRREEQARRVVITVVRNRFLPPASGMSYLEDEVVWHNYSDMPITNVMMFVGSSGSPKASNAVMAPGAKARWTHRVPPKGNTEGEYLLVFSDAAGVWWERTVGGGLVEIAAVVGGPA